MFLQASVILSTGVGGVCGRGHVWRGGRAWPEGACVAGGGHVCVVKGGWCAWWGGVHGWGVCVAGGHVW